MMKKLIPILSAFLVSTSTLAALFPSDISQVEYTPNHVINPTGHFGRAGLTSSGGTLSTSIPSDPEKYIIWDSSSADQTLTFQLKPSSNDMRGYTAHARFFVQCATGTCTHKLQMRDGSGTISEQAINSSTSTWKLVEVRGPWPSSSGAIRFISVAADEPALRIKQGHLGLALTSVGLAGSDTTAYTPTIEGFGTVTNVNFNYQRVGDKLTIEGTFTAGTVSADPARVTLPNSLITSSSYPSVQLIGYAHRNVNDSTQFGVVATPEVGYLSFDLQGGGGGYPGLVTRNGNEMIGTGDTLSVFASVKVQGWSAGVTMASDPAARDFVVRATGTPGSTTAGNIMVLGTEDEDTHNAYDPSTGRITIPQGMSGYWRMCGFVSIAGIAIQFAPYINGTTTGRTFLQSGADASFGEGGCIDVGPLKGGDLIDFRPDGTTSTVNVATLSVFKPKVSTLALDIQIPRSVRFSDATPGSQCTTSPCVLERPSTWVTGVTRSGTGTYAVSIASGIFSYTPVCTTAAEGGNNVACAITATSSASIGVDCGVRGTGLFDAGVNLICQEPN